MSFGSGVLFKAGGQKWQPEKGESSDKALTNWSDLNHIVYGLIDKYEPNPWLGAQLRAEVRVMQASGLVNQYSSCETYKACKAASAVLAELQRLLPRPR
jgi:hypothetical protein